MNLESLFSKGVFERYANEQDNLGRLANTLRLEDAPTSDISDDVGPWVVEWCSMGEQKGFIHIDTLNTHIRRNFEVLLGELEAQYIAPWLILGIFRTATEAGEFASRFRTDADDADK